MLCCIGIVLTSGPLVADERTLVERYSLGAEWPVQVFRLPTLVCLVGPHNGTLPRLAGAFAGNACTMVSTLVNCRACSVAVIAGLLLRLVVVVGAFADEDSVGSIVRLRILLLTEVGGDVIEVLLIGLPVL